MPPKKPPVLVPEDARTVSASFKVKVILNFEAVEDVGILLEWVQQDKPKVIDFGEVKDAELFTGELPLSSVAEQGGKDIKKPDANKAKAGKKNENALEIGKKYQGFFEYAEDDVNVNETFCNELCNRQFRLVFTNTDEMKIIHVVKLDFSRMLFHNASQTDPNKFDICFKEDIQPNKLLPWLESLTVRVETNKTLLKPEFKHFLNPVMIDISKIEDIYIDEARTNKVEPLLIRYDFLQNGSFVQTERVPTSKNVQLDARHVFLLGQLKQIDLKEHLERHRILVEVHDRDEIKTNNIRKSIPYLELKEPDADIEEDDPKKKKKPGQAAAKKPEPAKKKEEPKKDQKKKKDKKKDYVIEDFAFPPEREYLNREFGQAQLFLKDLLNPYCLDYELQAPLVPKQVFVDEDRDNLLLNKTARRQNRDIIKATDYFGSNTLLTMKIHLAFPLDRYRPIAPPKTEDESKVDLKKSSTIDIKKKTDDIKKPQPGKGGAQQEEEKVIPPALTEQQVLRQSQKLKVVSPKPVYERAIYVFEFKNREFLRILQTALVEVNVEGMKIVNGTERDVRTRKLTPSEREDKSLDYISGVEIIDKHFRMFLLEGLNELGMKRLEDKIVKTSANTVTFKILKNPNIHFENRLYSEFDIDVKKIKLRTSLKTLLGQPKLYSRKNVPQDTYDTIMRLYKLREKNTISEALESDAWPTAVSIIGFERNYGEALNDDDLYGIPPKRRIRKKGYRKNASDVEQKSGFASEVTSCISMEDVRESQIREQASQRNNSVLDGSQDRPPTVVMNSKLNTVFNKSTASADPKNEVEKQMQATAPTLPKIKRQGAGKMNQTGQNKLDPYSSKGLQPEKSENDSMLFDDVSPASRLNFRSNQAKKRTMAEHKSERYDLYRMQLLRQEKDEQKRLNKALAEPFKGHNVYSSQMEHLREQVRKDPNNFYTYSEQYMSLSVDPYTEAERRKQQDEDHRSRFLVPGGFNNVAKRETSEKLAHPKRLDEATAKYMKSHPYHEDVVRRHDILNPKDSHVGPAFKKYLPKLDGGVFMSVKSDDQKQTPAEAQGQKDESKKKEKEEWRKKMIVADPTFHVSMKQVSATGLDRFKGLLTGDPVKSSLKIPAKYIQDKVVSRDEILKPLPISYNLHEQKLSRVEVDKITRLDKQFNPTKAMSKTDFDVIKSKNGEEFIHKPRKLDVFMEK